MGPLLPYRDLNYGPVVQLVSSGVSIRILSSGLILEDHRFYCGLKALPCQGFVCIIYSKPLGG